MANSSSAAAYILLQCRTNGLELGRTVRIVVTTGTPLLTTVPGAAQFCATESPIVWGICGRYTAACRTVQGDATNLSALNAVAARGDISGVLFDVEDAVVLLTSDCDDAGGTIQYLGYSFKAGVLVRNAGDFSIGVLNCRASCCTGAGGAQAIGVATIFTAGAFWFGVACGCEFCTMCCCGSCREDVC